METLTDLKQYILRSGSEFGNDSCLWADSFAHQVITEQLRLHILLVDMERAKNAWPYRTLCRSEKRTPLRYIVLLRETSAHFRPLIWLKQVTTKESRHVMNFTFSEKDRSEYPEVVKVLFNLKELTNSTDKSNTTDTDADTDTDTTQTQHTDRSDEQKTKVGK